MGEYDNVAALGQQLNQSAIDIANAFSYAEDKKQQANDIKWQEEFSEGQATWQQQWAEKQFEYQKMLNELTMKREDNAIQRRAVDLAAAGLNPNLAVGQPASSQGFGGAGSAGVVGSNLGHRLSRKQDLNTQAWLDTRMRMAQVNQIEDQNGLLKSQQNYYEALAGKVSAETGNIGSNRRYLDAQADTLIWNLQKSKDRAIRTNDSGNYALIQQAIGLLERLYNSHNDFTPIIKKLDEIKNSLSDKKAKKDIEKFEKHVEKNVKKNTKIYEDQNSLVEQGNEAYQRFLESGDMFDLF